MASNRRNHAFTLIELLVVIAIIAILAAIMFPVFSRVRENARRSTCASNQKQLAMGLIQYAGDNDERLPSYNYWINFDGPTWFQAIHPYTKNWQIVRCPSVRVLRGTPFPESLHSSTYCMPGLGNTVGKRVAWDYDGLKQSEVSEPSRTWMIAESAYRHQDDTLYLNNGYGYPFCRLDNVTSGAPEIGISNHYLVSQRHFDGYNVAFMDGHVKWIQNGRGKEWIWDLNRAQ